jgi:hypothetical protein
MNTQGGNYLAVIKVVGGGGGGGAEHNSCSSTHVPRRTGEVLSTWEVSVKNDPCVNNPCRGTPARDTSLSESPGVADRP